MQETLVTRVVSLYAVHEMCTWLSYLLKKALRPFLACFFETTMIAPISSNLNPDKVKTSTHPHH